MLNLKSRIVVICANVDRDMFGILILIMTVFRFTGCRNEACKRGRRERYPSKFRKFGYCWETGTRQILEFGYQVPWKFQKMGTDGYWVKAEKNWVPGIGPKKILGYQSVPGTSQISII